MGNVATPKPMTIKSSELAEIIQSQADDKREERGNRTTKVN
jgi:hypothetical protein